MFIKIDLTSETPIYIQIKQEILKGIATGQLKEGDNLPPVRRLAEQLGINLHTVNKAYNFLKREGFISLNRKKGAVIIAKVQNPTRRDEALLEENLTNIVAEYYCKNFKKEDFLRIIDKIFSKVEGKSL